jgi:hypothetical protein
MTKRLDSERWWGGYAIRLEVSEAGWFYALRRDMPGDTGLRWLESVEPLPAREAAFEAAVERIIELGRQRSAGLP